MSDLQKILDKQQQFNSKWVQYNSLSLEDKEKWTKEFVLCCYSELDEIMRTVNWKHWKETRKPVDEKDVQGEIIDLLHFFLSLCLVWGMDAKTIVEEYIKKNDENIRRQQDTRLGYVKGDQK